MCVAVYKPRGTKIPSETLIRHLWSKNKDGGGFCYPKGDKIVGYKGFMEVEEFIKAIRKHLQRKVPALIHFRVATYGSKRPGGTHPFPATCDTNELKKVEWESSFGIVHNGTIIGYGSRTATGLSDTQAFIKEVLHDELVLHGLFMPSHSPALRTLIKSEITNDRIAVMRKDGKVALLGEWHQGYRMMFSNKDYYRCVTQSAKKLDQKIATYKEAKKRKGQEETENCYKNNPNRNKKDQKTSSPASRASVSAPPALMKRNPFGRVYRECPNCSEWVEYTFIQGGTTCCNLCVGDIVEKTIDIDKHEKPIVRSAAEICYPNEKSGSIIREMIGYGFRHCAAFGVWVNGKEVCVDCRYSSRRSSGKYTCKVLDDPDIELSVPKQNIEQAIESAVLEDVTLEILGGYSMMTQAAIQRTIYDEELFDYGEPPLTPETQARIDAIRDEAAEEVESIKRGGGRF